MKLIIYYILKYLLLVILVHISSIFAVSYTHLDVYKRQDLYSENVLSTSHDVTGACEKQHSSSMNSSTVPISSLKSFLEI